MKTPFGSILAGIRKEHGKMTQQQLAEKLGVERGAVANYESKGKLPHLETLIKIAELFQVSLDYLIGRSPVVALIKPTETDPGNPTIKILPIAVDKDNNERITLVPLRAAAG